MAPGGGTQGRHNNADEQPEDFLPPFSSRRTVDLLRGEGEGLFGGHALEEQEVQLSRKRVAVALSACAHSWRNSSLR